MILYYYYYYYYYYYEQTRKSVKWCSASVISEDVGGCSDCIISADIHLASSATSLKNCAFQPTVFSS